MPDVYAYGANKALGIVLYRDRTLASQIELFELVMPGGEISFVLNNFSPLRLAKLYQLVLGVWSEITDFQVTKQRVILPSRTTNQLLAVPKGAISLVQFNALKGTPQQLFIKLDKKFEVSDIQVSSLTLDTSLYTGLEFSLLELGPYTTSLAIPTNTKSFWVRSKLKGTVLSYTFPISITAKLYL